MHKLIWKLIVNRYVHIHILYCQQSEIVKFNSWNKCKIIFYVYLNTLYLLFLFIRLSLARYLLYYFVYDTKIINKYGKKIQLPVNLCDLFFNLMTIIIDRRIQKIILSRANRNITSGYWYFWLTVMITLPRWIGLQTYYFSVLFRLGTVSHHSINCSWISTFFCGFVDI